MCVMLVGGGCQKTARIYVTDALAQLTEISMTDGQLRQLRRLATTARPHFSFRLKGQIFTAQSGKDPLPPSTFLCRALVLGPFTLLALLEPLGLPVYGEEGVGWTPVSGCIVFCSWRGAPGGLSGCSVSLLLAGWPCWDAACVVSTCGSVVTCRVLHLLVGLLRSFISVG